MVYLLQHAQLAVSMHPDSHCLTIHGIIYLLLNLLHPLLYFFLEWLPDGLNTRRQREENLPNIVSSVCCSFCSAVRLLVSQVHRNNLDITALSQPSMQ